MIDLEKLRELAKYQTGKKLWVQAEELASILDKLAQLEKENITLQRDAERYRDLREGKVKNTYVTRYVGGATVPVYKGQALDALIDTAMEASNEA